MPKTCILLVADDASDIFVVQDAFKRCGITNPVHLVTDGEAAIYYLAGVGPFADRKRHPLPGLVLLDLHLARRTGLEVLSWIRWQPTLKRLVVIMLGAAARPSDIEQAYELGVNSFVIKPAGSERALEFAKLVKGWWLGCNRAAPIGEVKPDSWDI